MDFTQTPLSTLAMPQFAAILNRAEQAKRYAQVFQITQQHIKRLSAIERERGVVSHLDIELLMQSWSQLMLQVLRIQKNQIGMPSRSPVLLVGNHLSYVDICTVLTTKAVSFVAKAELQKWPIIGEAAKRAGIIFVKREEKSSRTHALTSVRQYLKRTQGSLCIFPSGTTHLTEARPWRYGPFQIAKSLGIPVQPFRIAYNQMRKVAYIDKDNFALHLWRLLDSEKLSVTIEFAEPFEVDNPEADAAYWWQWSRYPLLAANLAEKDGNL